jgi:hypothetical protein
MKCPLEEKPEMKMLSQLGTMTSTIAGTLARTLSATCALGILLSAVATAQGPGGMQGGGNTPFSNITRRPSMSPYMGLAFQGNNPETGGTLGAMQGLVRPQQQQFAQQQQAARQSRQLSQLQGQVRKIQRPTGNATIQTIRATGHASTFMEMSHFYPSAR